MTFQKGYTPWNKKYDGSSGSKLCECGCGETIPEFDNRGRPLRFKFKHGNKGRKFPSLKHDKQFKKGDVAWNKGIKGYTNKGTYKKGHEGMKGDKNPLWKGGVSYLGQGIRRKPEYAKWRLAVFEKDDYTCQLCFIRGGKLIADHFPYAFSKYPEYRLDIKNGRTLCVSCNYEVTYITKEWKSS